MVMRFLSYIFFVAFFFSYNVLAEVDQTLIDNVYAMTSSVFVKDRDNVSRPVQTLNMLAHELSLYPDERKATAAAKSIISMVAKGEGVKGGLKKSTSGPGRFLNPTEKVLVKDALTKAADYLQRQKLLDDFLEREVREMVGVWGDGETQKHGSIVLSLLMAAREKLDSNSVETAKVRAIGLIPETADALLTQVMDDSNWHSATAYLMAPLQVHLYNAMEWKVLEEARAEELGRDSSYATRVVTDFPVIALLPRQVDVGILEAMTKQLEETLIPEKALLLSTQIMGCLKHVGTDLRSLAHPTTPEQTIFKNAVIRALTAVERFRKYEIGLPGLDTVAPKVTDYQDLGDRPNANSQAVLLALVTVIQKLISHPMSGVDDLRAFFVFQRNDSEIQKPVTREALATFDFEQFINADLVSQVQDAMRVRLPIAERQRILIDQQALEHLLIYEAVPVFDFETGGQTPTWRFLRKINSEGDGWCGYYSLRNITNSKPEYIRRIADNLKIPEIRTLVERILFVGRNLFTELSTKLDANDANITSQQRNIIKAIRGVKEQKEEEMRARWPVQVPEHDQENARRLAQKFEAKEEPLYSQLAATAPLSEADLTDRISAEIDAIDYGQYLNMGSNLAWQDQPLTFPFINGLLTHDDMYVWINTQYRKVWRDKLGKIIQQSSVYENGQYMLVTFVSARDKHTYHARRIHLFNVNGEGHYDIWVEEDDYADFADALRHEKLYNLDLTRPIQLGF